MQPNCSLTGQTIFLLYLACLRCALRKRVWLVRLIKVLLALHQSAPACAHAHALIPKYS